MELLINRISKQRQFLYSILLVCVVSAVCFGLSAYIPYRIVAFILLFTVSVLAITFDIYPVLVAAVLTALIWDFFFIPPHFTLQVGSAEDVALLLTYFFIALVNAVLTYKIRRMEKLAREKEDRANTIKLYNTLLNSLSHELRTPIATIIAATDNLQSGTIDHDKQYDLVSEIAEASFRLNQQVENLLNMSRLEAGFIQPRKDWCDINELVYDAVQRIEQNRPSQRIVININPDIPLFKIDKGMLEQVIYNLLMNAVTYTPSTSQIDIIAMAYADVLELVIEDNGSGFPKEEISKVFEKFYRLKHSKTGGTGLGLSIVKGFVEAMGGSVVLENISNGGARFTIHIKAQTSHLKASV